MRGLLLPDEVAVDRLERALETWLGLPHVVLVSSGRQAMVHLLRAAGLRPGARVILPALTLAALVELVAAQGLEPVVVDVDPSSWGLSARAAEAVVREGDALLATHLFGHPCDLAPLQRLAHARGAVLLEDCAHALGARRHDVHVGGAGLGSLFSFETIKNLNTLGGGCVATTSEAVAHSVRSTLAELPLDPPALARKAALTLGTDLLLGSPAYGPLARAMSAEPVKAALSRAYLSARDASIPRPTRYHPAQASLGLGMLPQVEAMNAHSRQLGERYRQELGDLLEFQVQELGMEGSAYFMAARAPVDGRLLQQRLARRGVDAGMGAEVVDDCSHLSSFPCPVARRVAAGLVQLPAHHRMGERQVQRVIHAVRQALA